MTENTTEMAFNVDNLLNTNSTPSQEQRDNLQNSILQLDEAIFNSKLNTDEDISGIIEQAKTLERRFYSSLLSPVRCLPIEIFGEIFVYATRDRPRHVLNLSAVCQLWRDAALGTPVLWSTLELGHHTTKLNMDNHINSWIERAHSYPLSLVIRKRLGNFLDPVCSVLTLITQHQWKSITLDSGNAGNASILSILKKLEFVDLEMLESFSLAPRFHYKLSPPEALRYAPKLKTLSLFIVYPVALDTLPFPWRQLTSLTITSDTSYNIGVDVLRACVNLEELILAEEGSLSRSMPVAGSNNSITLNYLRKLHWHTHCVGSTFLLSLETPSIQDFAVDIVREGWQRVYFSYDKFNNGISDYIKKHGSTLLKLSIDPSESLSKPVDSIPYLRSLVEFKLSDDNYDDDGLPVYEILSFLVVNPEMDPSTIPLPRLEALEIICHPTEENQRMFMKVIGSRWWSDEEENARRKRGQRSLSRINLKRSIIMNVYNNELNMFYDDDADVLRAQDMRTPNNLPKYRCQKSLIFIFSFATKYRFFVRKDLIHFSKICPEIDEDLKKTKICP